MGGLGACLGRCLCGGAAAEGRKEVTVVRARPAPSRRAGLALRPPRGERGDLPRPWS